MIALEAPVPCCVAYVFAFFLLQTILTQLVFYLHYFKNKFVCCFISEKYGIRETPNLSTDADSSTDIFVFAGVKKKAASFFLPPTGAIVVAAAGLTAVVVVVAS